MYVVVHIYGTNTDICYEVTKLRFHAKSRKTSETSRALDIHCYGAMMTEDGVYLLKDGINATSVYRIPATDYRYVCIENYDSAKDKNKRELSQLIQEMEAIKK